MPRGAHHSRVKAIDLFKQLVCQTPTRRVNLGWISFQADGSISFGLNDKTYISPKFKVIHGVWSAYNRVKVQYRIPSDPTTLEAVNNPHFTYHPPISFRLKENSASNDDALFFAIADLDLTLRQEFKMPWLRATSAPISTLRSQRPRSGARPPDEFMIDIPDERLSVNMDLDFFPSGQAFLDTNSTWYVAWSGAMLRTSMSFTYPGRPSCHGSTSIDVAGSSFKIGDLRYCLGIAPGKRRAA
jgi:hypothetical protein